MMRSGLGRHRNPSTPIRNGLCQASVDPLKCRSTPAMPSLANNSVARLIADHFIRTPDRVSLNPSASITRTGFFHIASMMHVGATPVNPTPPRKPIGQNTMNRIMSRTGKEPSKPERAKSKAPSTRNGPGRGWWPWPKWLIRPTIVTADSASGSQ
jgi:hypothetical protein